MKKLLTALCLLTSFVSCGGGGGSGSSNACDNLGLRIANGNTCSVKSSPVVSLVFQFPSGDQESCSGTIITPTRILTAAHCIKSNSGDAVGGAAFIEGTQVSITGAIAHPSYSFNTSSYPRDVAIIGLKTATNIAPLPIIASTTVSLGEEFAAYGYGDTQRSEASLTDLESTFLIVSGVEDSAFSSSIGSDNQSVCSGDSGGPAVINVNGQFGIVGITSLGISEATELQCGVNGQGAIFTSVGSNSNLNFILQYASNVQVI